MHNIYCIIFPFSLSLDKVFSFRYQERIQNECFRETRHYPNVVRSSVRQNQSNKTLGKHHLNKLIREERNFQLLKLERRSIYDILTNQECPASPEFIARFRQQEEHRKRLVTISMTVEPISCIICLEHLRIKQHYAQWPCSNPRPHVFHYECMLKWLRSENKCPLCRQEVETSANSLSQSSIGQIFNTIFL